MNYELLEMRMWANSFDRQIDELSAQAKSRLLKIEKEMDDFKKSQGNQTAQPQGTSTQPIVGDSQPEVKPLTTQEVYEIAQNPQKWEQFMEEVKPELMSAWSRQ